MKFKAFTLLEIIITLALMSIVVSLVYVVYGYLARNLNDYAVMSNENYELRQFFTQLKEDIYHCDLLTTTNKKDYRLKFYDESIITYSLIDNYLHRKVGNTNDSIAIDVLSLNYLWQTSNYTLVPITEMRVTSKLYGKEVSFYVYKEYAPDHLINSK